MVLAFIYYVISERSIIIDGSFLFFYYNYIQLKGYHFGFIYDRICYDK